MEPKASRTTASDIAPCTGRSTWWAWLLWVPMCIGFSVLLALASFHIAGVFSPLLVFPLLVGVVLGASLVAMTRLLQVGHRPTIWTAVILSVLTVTVGQHFFSYRAAVTDDTADFEKLQMARAMFGDLVEGNLPARPTSFLGYLKYQAKEGRQFGSVLGNYTAKGAMAWLCWAIDGLLIALPVVVMVGFALRKPFCPTCGSWFSTRRCGRVDGKAIKRLADELKLTLKDSPSGGHYWIDSCDQGCTASIFSLFLEKSSSSKSPQIIWLDKEQRSRIVKILDEAQASK